MNDMSLYEIVKPLEKNFPVKIQASNGRGSSSTHWHEHIEFLYFVEGIHTVICAGTRYTAKERELFIVHSNELHALESCQPGLYICVRLFPSFFSDIQFQQFAFQQVISNDPIIHSIFTQMFTEHQQHLPGYDMELKAHAYHLMTYLMRNYKKKNFSEEELQRLQKRAEKMRAVLQYISMHYNQKLTSSSIAEHFHITEYHFCHLFKTETGLAPISYINWYRVEKAAILLRNTEQNITDIAAHVGFDDSNYFSRTFKKYMGVSPRAYRQPIS